MNSPVLQTIKTVKERLDKNYTSGQLFEVLDKLMYRAIQPLILHTTYVDRLLSIILAWYAQNHRRRISPHSKTRFSAYVIAFLAEPDPRRKFLLYKKMKLERNITFFLVTHWLTLIDPWRALHIRGCRGEVSRDIERQLMLKCCVTSESDLWATISHSRYWLAAALDFKEQIVEKYMRLAFVNGHAHWVTQRDNNKHLKLELEEVVQNFILAVIKAVDKFDPQQGTLTSYVQNWMKNAKITQQFRGEYGLAYTIPHSKKTSIARNKNTLTRNLSVSLDAPEVQEVADETSIEANLIHGEETDRIRKVAKAGDTFGIARLILGIQEVLSPQEQALLRAHQLQE